MTILEYIKTNPVADVQALLYRWNNDNWPHGCDKTCESVIWLIEYDKAWTKVILSDGHDEKICCYYNSLSGDEYLVTDRGETISQVMRLTGKTWRDSLNHVHRVECETHDVDYARNADIALDPDLDGLAQAIVTAMQIIADCLQVEACKEKCHNFQGHSCVDCKIPSPKWKMRGNLCPCATNGNLDHRSHCEEGPGASSTGTKLAEVTK